MLTEADIYTIGESVLMLVGAQHAMGHRSPAATAVDYVTRLDDPVRQFVVDAFTACAVGRGDAASERLALFVAEHDVLDLIADAVTH